LGITFIAFVITRFVPGGPLDQALAEKQQAAAKSRGISAGGNSSLSPQEELQLKRFYKLDRPLLAGYAEWLGVWPCPTFQQIVELPPSAADAAGAHKVTLRIPVKKKDGAFANLAVPAIVNFGKNSAGGLVPSVECGADAQAAVEKFAKANGLDAAAIVGGGVLGGWQAAIFAPEQKGNEAGTAASVANSATSAAPAATTAAKTAAPPVRVDIFQRRFDGLLEGNLGVSFIRGKPVLDVIIEKLPVSIWFGAWSLVLTYMVCIPLGVLKALRHRSPVDTGTSFFLFIGYALPGYILAVVFLYLFSFQWHIFPHSGFGDPALLKNPDTPFWTLIKDRVWHTFLPLVCLTSGSFALMTMLMKNTLLDNLAADYVRTAVAKGVGFRDAVLRHALRNSLVPIATGFGNCLAALLMGSFLIEKIFDIDGVGLLSFTSLVGRDYPVFLGLLTCTSFLLLLGNILSDVCVAFVDPRIRFGE
jgi:microcin C transport system permease protein